MCNVFNLKSLTKILDISIRNYKICVPEMYRFYGIYKHVKLNAKLAPLHAPLREVRTPNVVSAKLIRWPRYIRLRTSAETGEKRVSLPSHSNQLEKQRVSLKARDMVNRRKRTWIGNIN